MYVIVYKYKYGIAEASRGRVQATEEDDEQVQPVKGPAVEPG
jgi:hypothetical protein